MQNVSAHPPKAPQVPEVAVPRFVRRLSFVGFAVGKQADVHAPAADIDNDRSIEGYVSPSAVPAP